MQNDINKAAIVAVADAADKVAEMIRAKGEQPSTATITGYIAIMVTRMLDEYDNQHSEPEEER